MLRFIDDAQSICAHCLFFIATRQNQPANQYLITATPRIATAYVHNTRFREGVLLINLPQMSDAYNTLKIAYMQKPYQIAYYAENEWGAFPSTMLQSAMTKTLSESKNFKAVVLSPYLGPYQYSLSSRVQTLLLDLTGPVALLRLNVSVQLLQVDPARLIAARTFTLHEPLTAVTPYEAVRAANRVTARFLAELATFCGKQ